MSNNEIKDEYLGDGVYASFDGYHICLDLRGQGEAEKRIAIEPAVMDSLVRYADRCWRPARVCRVCGCTDDDCSQCVEKTGAPCEWVAEDLCSACIDEAQAGELGE